MQSTELAPGKLRKRNAEAFQDKAQLLRQQNGKSLKSLSAQPLYSPVCIALKSLPVLPFGVDNIDFFSFEPNNSIYQFIFYC